jgi:hypothetical protein
MTRLSKIVSVLVIVAATYTMAIAHVPERPDLDSWFNGLASSGGFPCCSFVDGSEIADVDWDTAVTNGTNHYRVRIDKKWIVVTPEEVVTGPNKFGRAVAWVYKDAAGEPSIRCFMPGAGG